MEISQIQMPDLDFMVKISNLRFEKSGNRYRIQNLNFFPKSSYVAYRILKVSQMWFWCSVVDDSC